MKIDEFHSRGWNGAQQRQQQQQSAKAGRTVWLLSARVMSQHQLRLILQVLDLAGVLESAGFCKIESRSMRGRTRLWRETKARERSLTWAEENDGLHTGEFRGVDHDGLVSLQGVVQVPDVRGHLAGLPRGGLQVQSRVRMRMRRESQRREFGGAEERRGLERQAPLDRV